MPYWLKDLGVLASYREPPHHSKFMLLDSTYNILLTGSPDGVLIRSDQSHIIIDYKTAKSTGTQDQLYPIYEAQLNAYALIGEQRGLTPVSALPLVYIAQGTYRSEVELVADAVRTLRERRRGREDRRENGTPHVPIWEVFQETLKDIPEEGLNQLPPDAAEQHDHYLYGTLKKPA